MRYCNSTTTDFYNHSVSFQGSSRLSKQIAYDTELLAIYEAIKHFRYMLEGRNFHVITDHKPRVRIQEEIESNSAKTNP